MKIPDGVQDLTANWLSEALRARGTITKASVSTVDQKIIGATQGAIGQLVRLRLTYDIDEMNAPSTLVAKLSAANPAMRADMHAFKLYEREVRFYERLAPKISLRTPKCYYSAIELKTGQSVLLLEDLAEGHSFDKYGTCSLAEAELAVNEIAKFHATWWESPQLNEIDWIPRIGIADFQRVQHRFQERWEPFLEKVGHTLPEPMLKIGEKWGEYIVKINSYLMLSPRTICQGDYQHANMVFFTASNGELSLVVIDWQVMMFCRGVIDVAFFCRGVTTEIRREQEMKLLRMYHTTLAEHGVTSYTFDACLRDYRLAMFNGLTRMVNMIGGGNITQEEEMGFRNVILPRTCAAILDLKADELLSDEWLGGF